MKITQEVREFAAKQNSDSYLAANPPQPVPAKAGREGDHAQHGGGAPATQSDAEEGMEEMSKVYREQGDRLYVPAKD